MVISFSVISSTHTQPLLREAPSLQRPHKILSFALILFTLFVLFPLAIICGVFFATQTVQTIFVAYALTFSADIIVNSCLGLYFLRTIFTTVTARKKFQVDEQIKKKARMMGACIAGWILIAVVLAAYMGFRGREQPLSYFAWNAVLRCIEVFIAYMHLFIIVPMDTKIANVILWRCC